MLPPIGGTCRVDEEGRHYVSVLEQEKGRLWAGAKRRRFLAVVGDSKDCHQKQYVSEQISLDPVLT